MVKPGEYRNPILTGYYPDPSVTRVGDDYYLVNSSFAHYPGLPIFRSRDLVNWTQIANAIDRPEQLDFKGRRISQAVFAPHISYHDGLFYIVNTCVDCKGNFVITAKDPAGPGPTRSGCRSKGSTRPAQTHCTQQRRLRLCRGI